jgi:hypothetical protein
MVTVFSEELGSGQKVAVKVAEARFSKLLYPVTKLRHKITNTNHSPNMRNYKGKLSIIYL